MNRPKLTTAYEKPNVINIFDLCKLYYICISITVRSTSRTVISSLQKKVSRLVSVVLFYFMYYLYYLSCDNLFYIGATNNVAKRKSRHYSNVKSSMKKPAVNTVHFLLAGQVHKQLQKPYQGGSIACYLTFRIAGTANSDSQIKELENKYLKENIGNKNCLNNQFSSRYKTKTNANKALRY